MDSTDVLAVFYLLLWIVLVIGPVLLFCGGVYVAIHFLGKIW